MTDQTTAPLSETATASNLSAAVQDWATALGREHVLTTEEEVSNFTDPYAPASTRPLAPAVLLPATVEEVQQVLKIAQDHGVSVWVNSQGRNNGYGGSAAAEVDTVVVSLRRMNQVLEINEELAYIVVEPGVSYFDLYEAVRQSGKRLMIDVPDLGWGSVLGNALEHGNGYTLNGDHAASVCGMEVVLPDGEVIRTGMGALDGAQTWHLNKRGFGPSVEGLFMQSNLGVVTKMGLWVMPRPEAYFDGWLTIERDEDLEELIDRFRPFMLDGTVGNCPSIFNPHCALSTKVTRADLWDQPGPLPQDVALSIGRSQGLGAWTMRFALYGDEAVVARHRQRIEDAFASLEGATVTGSLLDLDRVVLESEDLDQKQKVQAGVPDLSMLKMLDWDGAPGGHLSFASTVPLTGRDVRRIVSLVRTEQESQGIDYHAGILLYQRFAIHASLLIYNLDDEARYQTVRDIYTKLVVEAARLGYGEYRAHVDFMDLVSDQYGHNDHALRRFVTSLKAHLDPKGILAPGKQGIGSSRHRN
ncbi:FAD-binding oxidoreductase [Paeniglutamicibacter sp. MACA_103]|uniref:FAD-binding oxidoreductase n=1 Tax=Paeniglutamicibacter sp. MACA_103 TaxID=3377337 RepID=UPI003893005B